MNQPAFFRGRKLLIASMHRKEQVMAPVLEAMLGVTCFTSEQLDTDRFGTFCGSTERTATPLETAVAKCRHALEQTGADLGVASEGSFGPHPSLFFLPSDEEIVVLLDRLHGIEVHAAVTSLQTNFRSQEITDTDTLLAFAREAGFPDHGLLLRSASAPLEPIKGIRKQSDLLAGFERLRARHPQVLVETDMRAMHNPTRMRVIEEATQKLVEKLLSACPACQFPGYAITGATPGLPCAQCGIPTASPLTLHYACRHCGYGEDRRNQILVEDPAYCSCCNP